MAMSSMVWIGALLNGVGILVWLFGGTGSYGGYGYATIGIALTIIGWIVWVAGDLTASRRV